MRNSSLIILNVTMITLFSCNPSSNNKEIIHKYIANLNRYKEVKGLIASNLDLIKKEINYLEYDTIRKVPNENILSVNEYALSRLIIKQDLYILNPLLELWKDSLLVRDVSLSLNIFIDETIFFEVRMFKSGIIPTYIIHYIIYSPSHKPEYFLSAFGNKIIEKKELEKNWFYLIVEYYPD